MEQPRLKFAEKAAIDTGKLLVDYFRIGNQKGEYKPDRTLVTEADKNADLFLQEMISSQYPSDSVLSEENNTVYPDNNDVWVIDPLDGTVNFSLGLHYWGVAIAHLHKGMPQNAAAYFPLVDELYSASVGKGAELNGTAIHLSNPLFDSHYPIFAHCSRMKGLYNVSLPYKSRSLGSAAYQLCVVTKGSAILTFESTVKLWDFAASWLIIKEAGGYIQTLENQEVFPTKTDFDYNDQSYPMLAAASEEVILNAAQSIVPKR